MAQQPSSETLLFRQYGQQAYRVYYWTSYSCNSPYASPALLFSCSAVHTSVVGRSPAQGSSRVGSLSGAAAAAARRAIHLQQPPRYSSTTRVTTMLTFVKEQYEKLCSSSRYHQELQEWQRGYIRYVNLTVADTYTTAECRWIHSTKRYSQ